ncbi:MAG: ATPase domain-containing protein [archaeon]|nr:ATPase domain-containing protein [archaeon]
MIEKIKTEISGLDEILDGGIPKGNEVLIAGPAGSGKTIFSLEFLYKGAIKGEKGLYISFEESEKAILRNISEFGMDLPKYLDNNSIRIIKYDPYRFENLTELLSMNIKETGATRVVIDSITAINLYIRDAKDIRRTLVEIQSILRDNNCTAFLISEMPSENNKMISRFGVEEFVSDGIIILYYTQVSSEYSRSILVWKMRGSTHSRKIHPFKISKEGIVIYPREESLINL